MDYINRLPLELTSKIFSYLTSRECVPLVLLNKRLYAPAIRGIYDSVEIKGSDQLNLLFATLLSHASMDLALVFRVFSLSLDHTPADLRSRDLISRTRFLEELRLSINTADCDPVQGLPSLQLPRVLPNTLTTADIGGPATFSKNLHWDIDEALPFMKQQPLVTLIIKNATSVNIANSELSRGLPLGQSPTSLAELHLFNCSLVHIVRRAGVLPKSAWNDVAFILARFSSLYFFSITFHWDPNESAMYGIVNARADHLLRGITQSAAANTIIAFRFDLIDSMVKTTPIPGMHLLLQCRYLETSASHLQYGGDHGLGFADHFPTNNYSTLFPPNLQILKVTLGVTDFDILQDTIDRNWDANPRVNNHLPVLHAILRQKRGNAFFLPNLKKIIISDRFTQDPSVDVRAARVQGSIGELYEIQYPDVRTHAWRRCNRALRRDCRTLGIETMFVQEYRDPADLRGSGYEPFWKGANAQFGYNRMVDGVRTWVPGQQESGGRDLNDI